MKRKKYIVKVKIIFEVDMHHEQTSKEKAKRDIRALIEDYIKEDLDLHQIFDKEPYTIYKVEKIDDIR